jgi:hypothetical protein
MHGDFKNEVIDFLISICEDQEIILDKDLSETMRADIYIPGINCGIIFKSITDKKQKEELNLIKQPFKIIQLWEDQWYFHNEKIRSKIISLMGMTKRIHGRETNLIQIDNKQLMEFLTENHLNVAIKGKYKYGLLKDEQLVAVMSFSKGRQIVRENEIFNSFELLRFCNKLDTTVVGGFSKILHHFIKIQNPDDVMTYVDCDWSDGQSFLAQGFEIAEIMPAFEFWLNMKTGEREYPHIVLRQHEISELANEKDKSSFLEKHGYKKVYNSGSYKLLLKRKL